MSENILPSIKKVLGVPDSDTNFDDDIIMHINTCFATLNQIGLGPSEGYSISGPSDTWISVFGSDNNLNPIKTYVYLRVKLLFDPPATSFAIAAMEKQIEQLEWRLNVYAEGLILNA